MNRPNPQQPDIIPVDHGLRLRRITEDDYQIALPWYHDPDVLKGTAGPDCSEPYDRQTVVSMFEYLSGIGECYIIEVLESDAWVPIGDVTLSETTLPIVIGNTVYWNKGIGKRVIQTLIRRAKQIGFEKITLKEIYFNNERSLRLFTSCGFKEIGRTEYGFVLEIDVNEHSS